MQMADVIDKSPDVDHGDMSSSSSQGQKILSDELPPLEILRQMIKYETTLRLSEPIQQLLDLYHTSDDAITYVEFYYYYFQY